MIPVNWNDHTLENPAIDAPAGERLETFVKQIGRDLRPYEGNDCNLQKVASALRMFFNLKPPIHEPKINTFLEVAGIHQASAEGTCLKETTFIYNQVMSRWEIYVRRGAPQDWSREVWHDVWEVLFWRCYHVIPWWRTWATRKGYDKPHDKADEFVFLMLLPPQSVPGQAKKHYYDVWEIAKYYCVPINLAFRALQQYTRLPHPVIFAIVGMDVPGPPKNTLFSDLFEENYIYAEVRQKAYKRGRECELLSSQMACEWQVRWRAVERMDASLRQWLNKQSVLRFSEDDIVYRYGRHTEATLREVQNLFGIDLLAPVSVISRQSPYNAKDLFLQIVPCGCEDAFLPRPLGLNEALLRTAYADWRRAARSVKARPTVALVPAGIDEEEDPFQWQETN